ncbi:uridine kinase [Actinomadura barringtoniae]|uniref:Uridine kinase n=1 Tax=Actinomadura barringtoniae TaxID=1427535 RepID=A0A939PIK9_9ACTN|nr:uridine kinase [Actinomadura barringtoniae]MBO2453386.1 uridine kinase [Actinomadura barringtoniae]
MRALPISPEHLVEELSKRMAATPDDRWLRVAVDGPPPALPGELADALVDPLRVRGRDVVRVAAAGFLRPASLRLEFGRDDPDVFYDEWLDEGGLVREVLAPLAPGGSGKVLPSLWDSVRDRATRAQYRQVAEGGVLVLDGALLLGRGLPFDLTVHLSMSSGALARRTPGDEAWTLPAYARYEAEVRPVAAADVAVKVDDPRHPALITG